MCVHVVGVFKYRAKRKTRDSSRRKIEWQNAKEMLLDLEQFLERLQGFDPSAIPDYVVQSYQHLKLHFLGSLWIDKCLTWVFGLWVGLHQCKASVDIRTW